MIIKFGRHLYSRHVDLNIQLGQVVDYIKETDYCFMVSHSRNNFTDQCTGVELESVDKVSAVIDILADHEAQLMMCHATTRNEIRRTYKSEDYSILINPEIDDQILDFYNTCEWERDWIPAPKEEIMASLLIIATYKGEYIAGISGYYGNDILRVGRIFGRRKSKQHSDWPQVIFAACSKRVVFEFTRLCVSMGLKFLDLGGIDFESPEKNGISKYKMSFGSRAQKVRVYRYKSSEFVELASEIKEIQRDLT